MLVKGQGHDDLGNNNDESEGLGVIQDLLDDMGLVTSDEKAALEFEDTDTVLTVQSTQNRADIDTSGNVTLNFVSTVTNYTYKPMDISGNIKFFGCVTTKSDCEATESDDPIERPTIEGHHRVLDR